MTRMEIKLLPNADGTKAYGAYEVETNLRGTWEKSSRVEFTSDDAAAELSLSPYERLTIAGHEDYEMVYNKEQNVSTIVKKTHEEPPPPEVEVPPPEADPTADPTARRAKR